MCNSLSPAADAAGIPSILEDRLLLSQWGCAAMHVMLNDTSWARLLFPQASASSYIFG